MTLDLYVDIRSQTLIQSHRNGGKFVVPRHYRQQVIWLRVFYVSPNPTGGAANPYTIEDSSTWFRVRVAIGGFDEPLAVCSGLTYNATDDCWEGDYLNLNTEEMNAAVDAATGGELSSIFETEVEAAGDAGRIKTQDPVTIKRTVLQTDSGTPTPVNDTTFCDQLEICLGNSDTLTWRRVANQMLGDVPLFGAPAILATLEAGYPEPAVPPSSPLSTDTDSAVVGGVAGERYLIRARFSGVVDEHSGYGGYRKPGDDTHIARDAGEVDPNDADLWYIEISSPPQRIYLNAGDQPPLTAVDYYFRFVVDSGATVTLTFEADPVGGAGQHYGTLEFVSASEVLTNDSSSSYEAIAFSSAGNTDVTPQLDSSSHGVIATVTAGGGAFTRTVSLLTANSTAGDRCVIHFIMPASTNPLIQVRNATSGGTLLCTITGETGGDDICAEFLFDGTAWQPLSANYLA